MHQRAALNPHQFHSDEPRQRFAQLQAPVCPHQCQCQFQYQQQHQGNQQQQQQRYDGQPRLNYDQQLDLKQLQFHPSSQNLVHKQQHSHNAHLRQIAHYALQQHQNQHLNRLTTSPLASLTELQCGHHAHQPATGGTTPPRLRFGSLSGCNPGRAHLESSPDHSNCSSPFINRSSSFSTPASRCSSVAAGEPLFAGSPASSSAAAPAQPACHALAQAAAATAPTSISEALNLGINLEQYISKRNERERSRVRNVNKAFDNLKNSLPLDTDRLAKRMSKVEILRTAISYIRDLEQVLDCKRPESGRQSSSSNSNELSAMLNKLSSAASPPDIKHQLYLESSQSKTAPDTTTLFTQSHELDSQVQPSCIACNPSTRNQFQYDSFQGY